MGNIKKSIQTGLPRGTWSYLDKHPTEDMFFHSYRKAKGVSEYWMTDKVYQRKLKQKRDHHRKNYISVSKRPNYQTGSDLGTYSCGQEHPLHDGIFFIKYRPERRSNEYWVDEKKMKELLGNVRERNGVRCSRVARVQMTKEEVKRIKMIYRIRDIKNETHKKIMYHVDHITPLSKGGLHHSSNLQLATAKWNLTKGTKIL